MSIRITCPDCRTTYGIADQLRGRKVRCRDCGRPLVVDECLASEEDLATVEAVDEAEALQREPRPAASRAARRESEKGPRDVNVRKRRWGRWRIALVASVLALLTATVLGGPWWFDWFGVNFLVADAMGWPTPQTPAGVAPGELVTLHVINVSNDETRTAISRKLRAMAAPGENFGMSFSQNGDRLALEIYPVADPEAFAKRIDFGSVRRVRGRTIRVVAYPVRGVSADADPLTLALHELELDDPFRSRDALRRIAAMQPNERRREVAAALERKFERHGFDEDEVAAALGVWGDEESLPAILRALDHPFTARHALKLLAKLKDERAIEPLAARLEDFRTSHDAAEALQAFGPSAEQAVAKRLKHHDRHVGRTACGVLEAIGTEKSIAPLEKVVAENDFFVTDKANEAIRAIRRRE